MIKLPYWKNSSTWLKQAYFLYLNGLWTSRECFFLCKSWFGSASSDEIPWSIVDMVDAWVFFSELTWSGRFLVSRDKGDVFFLDIFSGWFQASQTRNRMQWIQFLHLLTWWWKPKPTFSRVCHKHNHQKHILKKDSRVKHPEWMRTDHL